MLAVVGLAGSAGVASAVSPAVVSRAPGYLEVFTRDPGSGALLIRSWNYQTGWGPLGSLGGVLSPDSDIAAVSRGVNHLSVYVRGTDNALYQIAWDGGSSWTPWQNLGGVLTGGPSAVAWDGTREDVLVRATGGDVAQKTWTSTTGWGGWVSLGGGLAPGTGPAASSRAPGYMDVAVTGTDRRLYIKSFRPDTGWFDWYAVNGTFQGGPGIASQRGAWNGRQDYLGVSTQHSIAQMTYLNGGMIGWTDLGGGIGDNIAPAPIWWQSTPGGPLRFDVFTYGTAGTGTLYQKSWDPSTGWGTWTIPSTSPTGPPPVIANGSQCKNGSLKPGSAFGLSMGRDAVKVRDTQLAQFDAVIACFRAINGGAAPMLRLQVPIDAMRRPSQLAPGVAGGPAQIQAFKDLLGRIGSGAQGVVSIMSPTFDICNTAPYAEPESPAGALGRCKYPTQTSYRTMFTEIVNAVNNGSVKFTAWNEPDFQNFLLRYGQLSGYGTASAAKGARLAGRFWAHAASIVGSGRVLAGEFASGDQALISEFGYGRAEATMPSGVARPTFSSWSLHEYSNASLPAIGGMEQAVGGPIWGTEIGARTDQIIGDSASFTYGQGLLNRLRGTATKAFMYYLQDDGTSFDSALLDGSGRARKVLCGLGGLSSGDCLGSTS